jgi:hypothetical protein
MLGYDIAQVVGQRVLGKPQPLAFVSWINKAKRAA